MKTHLSLNTLFAILFLVVFAAAPARAVVLISNLSVPDAGSQGQVGDLGGGNNQWFAVQFTMGGDAYFLQSITLRLLGPTNPNPVVQIRGDGGAVPGGLISATNGPDPVLTGLGSYNFFPVSPTELGANNTYWLVVGNTGAGSSYRWKDSDPATAASGLATAGQHRSSLDGGTTFGQIVGERYKFEINGNLIPEPSTALLFLAGIAGLGLRRRR